MECAALRRFGLPVPGAKKSIAVHSPASLEAYVQSFWSNADSSTLVLETDTGIVVIDHKAYPGNAEQALARTETRGRSLFSISIMT